MAYGHKCAIEYCNNTAAYGVAKVRYKTDDRTEYRVFTRPILKDEKLLFCANHAFGVKMRKEALENE